AGQRAPWRTSTIREREWPQTPMQQRKAAAMAEPGHYQLSTPFDPAHYTIYPLPGQNHLPAT
ncbi:hypothetical protein, partial [Acidithiobacillus thiooxidans]|uniref:hypothetical protein n=1 Tax=Acidithiobacillus thiooxidans TaxID=930 RepID=UPI001ED9C42E